MSWKSYKKPGHQDVNRQRNLKHWNNGLQDKLTMSFQHFKDIGNEHFKKGEYDLAIEQYRKCISLEPTNAVGYSNLAMAYLKNRCPDEAKTACEMGLSYCKDTKLRQKLQYRLELATTNKRPKTLQQLEIREVERNPPELASL